MNCFLIKIEPLTFGWAANAVFYSTQLEVATSDKYTTCNTLGNTRSLQKFHHLFLQSCLFKATTHLLSKKTKPQLNGNDRRSGAAERRNPWSLAGHCPKPTAYRIGSKARDFFTKPFFLLIIPFFFIAGNSIAIVIQSSYLSHSLMETPSLITRWPFRNHVK